MLNHAAQQKRGFSSIKRSGVYPIHIYFKIVE